LFDVDGECIIMWRGKKTCPWLNGLDGDICGLIGDPVKIKKKVLIKNRVKNENCVIFHEQRILSNIAVN
jgi:hypothetical protein